MLNSAVIFCSLINCTRLLSSMHVQQLLKPRIWGGICVVIKRLPVMMTPNYSLDICACPISILHPLALPRP